MTTLKVIIIGGGIGGLTCARACLDAGFKVELFEKRPLDQMLSGPGGIFIQKNAMRVYELLWEGQLSTQLYEQGGKILEGGFFNQQGKPLYINAPNFANEDDLGVCLLRPTLQKILYNSLPNGVVKTSSNLINFQETNEGVNVFFEDGFTTTGNLLIGADGLYSKVRARLKGQEKLDPPIYSGTTCWRGFFSGENISLDPQYSWAELWGKGDRFGYFNVGKEGWSFYAFSNTKAGGNDPNGDSKAALLEIFSDYAEPIASIIEALDENKIYRNDIFDRTPLGNQWGKGRVTLIGDAAHPVQPSIGQGGCMAIEDAYELVKQLLVGEDNNIISSLRQFEQNRSERVEKVFTTSRQIGKFGQLDSSIGCFLRNWVYKLTPTWLGDLQFKWLFDYQPTISLLDFAQKGG